MTFRPSRRLAGLIAALCVCAAAPACSTVDVYMGFMDEEVNDVLKSLIKQHPDRRVIVVERGAQIKPGGKLFQRALSSYGGGSPEILSTAGVASGNSLEATIANGIKIRMETPEFKDRIQELVMSGPAGPKTLKEGAVDPTMTVVGFNMKAPADDPIVLVRSPEMGLQPSMVAPYLDPILSTLRSLDAARPEKGGLHASVYGTGGAISPSLKPGELSSVKGSVYVGSEKITGGGHDGYRGVIAIADGKSAPSVFYSEDFPTREAAEAGAREAFTGPGARFLTGVSGPLKGKTLGAAVRGIDPGGAAAVSLTVSFFGGDDMKTAGRTFGLGDVNMEDYHVLNAIGEKVDTFDVARLNCDPHEITPETSRLVSKWGIQERYTIATYEDSIIWGLRGSPQEHMPASADWGALSGLPGSKIRELALPTLGPNGKPMVLDPFFAEIGTDFLTDAAGGKLLTSRVGNTTVYYGMVSKKITDQLSSDELAQLNLILKAQSDRIRVKARSIVRQAESAATPEALEALRPDIRLLMLATKDVAIPPGGLRNKIEGLVSSDPAYGTKGSYFERTGRIRLMGADNDTGGGDKTRMELWVREGKWAGNTGRVLDHILVSPGDPVDPENTDHGLLSEAAEHGELSGSNVDRALYKATITPGTQLTAPDRVILESPRLRRVGQTFIKVGRLVQDMENQGIPAEKAERIGKQLLSPCQ